MFLRYDNVVFSPAGLNNNTQVNGMPYMTPSKELSGPTSGAGLVLQYLESFIYKVDSYSIFSQADIQDLYSNTKSLDQQLSLNHQLVTLKSLLESCKALRFVKNCGIKYFNTLDALKYFVKEYKSVIVELKLTDTTKNAHQFEIASSGQEIVQNASKGFICCGYDSNSFLLQNTLGTSCGVRGFNKISSSLMSDLFIKGGCFSVI